MPVRKKRRILIGIAALLLLAGVTWRLLFPPDPIFHGKPESYWFNSLTNSLANMPVWIENQRTWQGFGPEAIPLLVKAAQLQESSAQKAYSKFWHGRSPGVQRFLSPPVDYLSIRLGAMNMLSMVGQKYEIPLSPLLHALEDSDASMRMNAVSILNNHVLPKLGPEKESILPALMNAMNDSQSRVRMVAAVALQYFPSQAEKVGPILVKALGDSDPDVRIRAVLSLYKIDRVLAGKNNVALVAADCLKADSPHGAARFAAQFLKEISSDSNFAISSLMGGLQNGGFPRMREQSANTLGEMGSKAREAVPALLRAMRNDTAQSVRIAASNALFVIDPEAIKAERDQP